MYKEGRTSTLNSEKPQLTALPNEPSTMGKRDMTKISAVQGNMGEHKPMTYYN